MGVGKSMESRVCPRCGERYSYLETSKRASNVYVYAVHYYYENGKRKKRKCYLGPLESYIYVTKLHTDVIRPEGLVLEGAISENRAVRYIEALTNYFEHRSKSELSEDSWVYIEDYVPMRLNYVFDELRRKGFKVIEAHVYEGYLILVCDYLR